MLKKTVNILYVIILLTCLTFIIIFYLSEENIRKKNKIRSMGIFDQSHLIDDLPLLLNDTKDIIDYDTDVGDQEKNKKYYKFFELLKKN